MSRSQRGIKSGSDSVKGEIKGQRNKEVENRVMVPAFCVAGVNKKGLGEHLGGVQRNSVCLTLGTGPSNGSSEGGHAFYQATSNHIRVLE